MSLVTFHGNNIVTFLTDYAYFKGRFGFIKIKKNY